MIKVYVAGPYSNPKPEIDNAIRAIEQADKLWEMGFCPFIPHLAHWWHEEFPHDYEMWMSWGDEWLKRCDALFLINGESPGAEREVISANRAGIPVFCDADKMFDYFHRGGIDV
jgi:hypothetical protein